MTGSQDDAGQVRVYKTSVLFSGTSCIFFHNQTVQLWYLSLIHFLTPIIIALILNTVLIIADVAQLLMLSQHLIFQIKVVVLSEIYAIL